MVTEALLEMHFHPSIVKLFEQTFGRNYLQLIKPSQQQESFVGFDQGWVRTNIPRKAFFDALKKKVQNSDGTFDELYLAYFFQFKVVDCMVRGSHYKPAGYNVPYYRSEVSLKPNDTTNLSQHDTLLRLANIGATEVSYACGMMFSADEVYDVPDLERLRFVRIETAPLGWCTDERHFIAFQSPNDSHPLWCSEPVRTQSYSITDLIDFGFLRLLSPPALLRLFTTLDEQLPAPQSDLVSKVGDQKPRTSRYPESFSIVEFDNTRRLV